MSGTSDLPPAVEGQEDLSRKIAPSLPPELRLALHTRFASVQHKGIRDFTAALRLPADGCRDEGDQLPARAICLVVADLIEQGWKLTLAHDHFSFEPPGLRAFGGDDLSAIKARIRASLRVSRDRQLEEPSVRVHPAHGTARSTRRRPVLRARLD